MYSGLLAVTNRKLCERDFLEQIERLAKSDIEAIILREKDLDETAYEALAESVLKICGRYKKTCILHTFTDAAIRLGCTAIHLPLPVLLAQKERLTGFERIGVSVHSVEEARFAAAAGATYLMAGHIYETDCKRGLPGRGLSFLKEVCENVSIPVYAIGGITPERLLELKVAGAAGGCIMSLAMKL